MIRHVVLWRLKSDAGDRFAERPQLRHLETRAVVDPLIEAHWIVDYVTTG